MADKMNTDYWNNFYSSIIPAAPSYHPGMMGRGLPLSAVDRLPRGTAGIDPIGWKPPTGPAWNEPTSIDLAAIDKWNAGMGNNPSTALAYAPAAPVTPAVSAATNLGNPVTNVTASLKSQPRGGLLDLLFGPSKNGLGGLAGLLGGPGAGGLVGMLGSRASSGPVTGDALIARATGATSSAENQAWRRKTYGGDGGALGAS